ncbi:MAG: GntR family transcriptional regulator [Chloroflexota bacterium]
MMLSSTLLTASRQQRIKQDSQSELAYRVLKEKIITLEYPPATLLNEAQLIAELNLGRTPIREALQRLAFDNLVVILPRRGTIVADLNMSDIQKIFEIRVELEARAAYLAARRATPAQIAEMEALFSGADEIICQGNHHQLIALDHQLHCLVVRAAQNEFLEEILERLYTHILRLWYVSLHKVSRLAEAIQEHRDIIAAIRAGNGEQAAQIMRTHITGFQREFNAVS